MAADAAGVDARFRRAMRAAPALAFPGIEAPQRLAFERAWWTSIVATALGVPDADPRLPPCVDPLFLRSAQADAWSVFDDVVPALQALRAHGLRLAVVSNFDGRLPGLLANRSPPGFEPARPRRRFRATGTGAKGCIRRLRNGRGEPEKLDTQMGNCDP